MEVPAPNGANTNTGNPAGGIDPKSGTALNYLTDSNSHSPAVSNASAAKTDKLEDKEEQGQEKDEMENQMEGEHKNGRLEQENEIMKCMRLL